jgi:hypothetical protein
MIKNYYKTWENSNSKLSACFVSTPENFTKSKRGKKLVRSQEIVKGRDLISDGQYIYHDLKEFSKFKNSKVLVLGGGPTTKDVEWDENNYDYIFSVNNFFKSQRLKDIKVDVCFIGGEEVDSFDKEFINYFKKYKTFIGIENIYNRPKHYKNIQKMCSCRVQCKALGTAPKALIFALCLGVSQVDCLGIDGVPVDFNKKKTPVNHAFLPDKKWGANYTHELHVEQFRILDHYLKETFPNQIVNNLGKGHPYNCWSKI